MRGSEWAESWAAMIGPRTGGWVIKGGGAVCVRVCVCVGEDGAGGYYWLTLLSPESVYLTTLAAVASHVRISCPAQQVCYRGLCQLSTWM